MRSAKFIRLNILVFDRPQMRVFPQPRYTPQPRPTLRYQPLMKNFLRSISLSLYLVLVPVISLAQLPARDQENFMVVVRESIGANRAEDLLTPTGKLKAKLADGREIEIESASWEFIGDTHIRFVFDGPQTMINAAPADLGRLGIKSVEQALLLALTNIKRVYGEPSAVKLDGGLIEISGKSPDLNSSYFLDRPYWQNLLKSHSDGIVVSIVKRGSLIYAPLSESPGVETLKRAVASLHASSGRLRVSSGLYLFKAGKWSVFQDPVKQ